ncbi:MAG TPA: hypothetical protein VFR24_19255 [Candidatus Angelobacter sp.]|nr:hypothetical protein [Candidatus Angelobacter sp.]
MSNQASARGSQKLLAQLVQKRTAATPEEVKAAVSIPTTADYKLLRWQIRGIPPFYYELETDFQVAPQNVGELVNHFAVNSAIRNINILINGIPKPDIATVNVVVAESGE